MPWNNDNHVTGSLTLKIRNRYRLSSYFVYRTTIAPNSSTVIELLAPNSSILIEPEIDKKFYIEYSYRTVTKFIDDFVIVDSHCKLFVLLYTSLTVL